MQERAKYSKQYVKWNPVRQTPAEQSMYMRYIQVLTWGQVSLQTNMYQFCVFPISMQIWVFEENIVSIESGIQTNGLHLF